MTCGKWGSVSLCIFGVLRICLLGYLMYLWLNPLCSWCFHAVAASLWCWGLLQPLPCPSLLVFGWVPAAPPRSPGPWELSPPALPFHSKDCPPWQQLLLAGFGGSSSWNPCREWEWGWSSAPGAPGISMECSKSRQLHWESQTWNKTCLSNKSCYCTNCCFGFTFNSAPVFNSSSLC